LKKVAILLLFRFFVFVPIVMGQTQTPASQIKKGGTLIQNVNNALDCDTVNDIATQYDLTQVVGGGTDTTSLSDRIDLKLDIADTASMLSYYLRKIDTLAMLLPYLRSIDAATYYYPLSSNPAGYLTSVGTLDSTTISGFHTYNFYNTNPFGYLTSLTGAVLTSRTLTINGTGQDLSADRTWSVGTVTSIATTSPITGGTITGTGTIAVDTSILHSYNYYEGRYQAKLVSGTNIKTINGSTILGSGDLAITGSGSPTTFDFTDQSNVNISTLITSNGIILAGDSTVVWAFAVRGNASQMQVNSNSWTTEGIARVGDTLHVRLTSSSAYSTMLTCFLRCNGLVVDWHVTTASFLPSAITGLRFWVSADAGVTTDGADLVSAWDDQSGQANHALQATGTNQPKWYDNILNGKPIIRFDGVDNYMNQTSSDTYKHAFIVAKWNGATFTDYCGLWGPNTVGPAHPLNGLSGGTIFADPTDVTSYYLNSVNYATSNMQAPMNAFGFIESAYSTGWTFTGQIGWDRSFGTRFWNGDIAEIIIYDHVVTGTDLTDLRAYILAKYGTMP